MFVACVDRHSFNLFSKLKPVHDMPIFVDWVGLDWKLGLLKYLSHNQTQTTFVLYLYLLIYWSFDVVFFFFFSFFFFFFFLIDLVFECFAFLAGKKRGPVCILVFRCD